MRAQLLLETLPAAGEPGGRVRCLEEGADLVRSRGREPRLLRGEGLSRLPDLIGGAPGEGSEGGQRDAHHGPAAPPGRPGYGLALGGVRARALDALAPETQAEVAPASPARGRAEEPLHPPEPPDVRGRTDGIRAREVRLHLEPARYGAEEEAPVGPREDEQGRSGGDFPEGLERRVDGSDREEEGRSQEEVPREVPPRGVPRLVREHGGQLVGGEALADPAREDDLPRSGNE